MKLISSETLKRSNGYIIEEVSLFEDFYLVFNYNTLSIYERKENKVRSIDDLQRKNLVLIAIWDMPQEKYEKYIIDLMEGRETLTKGGN
jgi:hypothetical protein